MNGIPDGITLDAPTPDGITLDAAPAQPTNVPFGRWGRAPAAAEPALAPGGQLSPYAPPSGSPDMPTYAAQPGSTPTEVAIDNSSVGRILDAFGQGAKSQWGDQPLGLAPDSEKWLRENGLWNDYQKGQGSPFKSFNEMLMRPVAAALDAALRLPQTVIGAVGGGGAQTAMEAGLPQAIEKAAGVVPENVKDVTGTATGGAEQANLLATLSGAVPEALFAAPKSLGVTAGEGEYLGTAAVRPGPTVERAAVMPSPAPPVTIAQAAIKVGDKVFTGQTHADAMNAAIDAGVPMEEAASIGVRNTGYTTSAGDFVDREQAKAIVDATGQTARVVKGRVTSQGTLTPTAEELAAATTPEARAAAFAKYGLDAEGKPVTQPIETPDAPTLPPEPSKVEVPNPPVQDFKDMEPSTAGTKLNLNYDSSQEVRDFFRQQAIEAGDFSEVRRGTVSWAETERLGQATGLSTQFLLDRKIGDIWTASQMDAATKALVDSTRNVREIWQKAATGSDADKLAALEAEAQHSVLMGSVIGNEAEVGRALNIIRKFKQTTREARDVDQLIKDNGGIENLRDRAEKGALLDTPAQISGFIRDTQKPRLKDMLVEVFMNWLLSGPATQTKNLVGNLTTALWRTTESGVAAGIGVLRGMPEDRVYAGEAYQRTAAFVTSGPEMIKAAWKAWKEDDVTGSKLELGSRYQSVPSAKISIAGHDFLIGGKQLRIPGRALAATDAAFKALAYRQSINAQAWRRAAKAARQIDNVSAAVLRAGEEPRQALPAPTLDEFVAEGTMGKSAKAAEAWKQGFHNGDAAKPQFTTKVEAKAWEDGKNARDDFKYEQDYAAKHQKAVSEFPQALADEVNTILDRITPQREGTKFMFGKGERLSADMLSHHGLTAEDKNATLLGQTSGSGEHVLIKVALDMPEKSREWRIPQTTRHEAVHALKKMGLFTSDEWRSLEQAAHENDWHGKFNKPKNAEGTEEAIADAFGYWATGTKDIASPKYASVVERAFGKITEFFKSVKDALAGNGSERWQRIFADVENGVVGQRQIPAWMKSQDGEAASVLSGQSKRDTFTRAFAALKNNPTAGMIERAVEEAKLQTLNQDLGKTGKAIQTVANHNIFTKIVAPFVKFGINDTKFAGERSVLSLLHPEIRKILDGEMGAAARDEQIAKITVGSAVAATAVYLAANGMATGEGPKDPAQRALLRATGWQPHSFKIGDTYYAGDWNDPASTVFFVAADLYDMAQEGYKHWDDRTFAETTGAVGQLLLASIINNIASKTYFQGASDALDAIQDPVRYGPQYINKLAGTAVPTGVAQWARVQDPYLRDARTIIDTIKSRLPKTPLNPQFNSESVFPSRDVWGNAIQRGGAAGPDILSPVYTSKAKQDPITNELLSLGVFPAKLDRQIRGVDLDAKEYDDYQRVAGKLLRYQLEQIIGRTPNWNQIQPGIRQEVLTKAVSQSREIARKYVMMAHPDIIQKATQAKINLLTGQ